MTTLHHRPGTTPAADPPRSAACPDPLAKEQLSALLKALADPLRLEVAQALAGGERCVCDLTASLGLAQSRLSFHLKVMRQAGLIRAREEGRWVYYSLAPEAVQHLRQWLGELEQRCQTPAAPCAG